MRIAWTQRKRKALAWALLVVVAGLLAWWKPLALVEGVQRGGLYALIALPMALILGVVGIINLAHGEFLMLGAYLAFWLWYHLKFDPILAMIPALAAFAMLGAVTFSATVRRVLKAPELIQLLLTYGLALIGVEIANLLWTSRPYKPFLRYSFASATLGSLRFGAFPFVYTGAAIVVLLGLLLFLRRTRTGQAAAAVGQNPRGASLVGIDVNRTYLVVFSLAVALVGAVGGLYVTRHVVFPHAGSPYTMKSFCLIAMAGIGNLPGVFWSGLTLGVAESFVMSFRAAYGWADVVFFAVLVAVIMAKSYRIRRLLS